MVAISSPPPHSIFHELQWDARTPVHSVVLKPDRLELAARILILPSGKAGQDAVVRSHTGGCRVAGCAKSFGSAGYASATVNSLLIFRSAHSMQAGQCA